MTTLLDTVEYANFWKLRGDANASVRAVEDLNGNIAIKCPSLSLFCQIDRNNPKHAEVITDWDANKKQYANLPVFSDERRFGTHGFANGAPITWDSQTTGDSTAWAVGGYVKNPLNGLWLTATGAGALGAWAGSGGPGRLMAGTPNSDDLAYFTTMFANQLNIWSQPFMERLGYTAEDKGSLYNTAAAYYDDVHYKWIGTDNATIAWLDLDPANAHEGAPVWKDGSGTVIVRFDATDQKWFRQAEDASWSVDVTDSTFRLKPYEGYKLSVNGVRLYFNLDSVFDLGTPDGQGGIAGRIHYRGTGYGDNASLPSPAPAAGIWTGKDFVYSSRLEMERTTNGTPTPPDADGNMSMSFDYLATRPNWLDSLLLQHVDLVVEGNAKVTSAADAQAWFFCVMWGSF